MPLSLGGKLFKSASVLFDMIKIYFDENLRPNIRVIASNLLGAFGFFTKSFHQTLVVPSSGFWKMQHCCVGFQAKDLLDILRAALHLFQTITTIFLTLPLYGITTPIIQGKHLTSYCFLKSGSDLILVDHTSKKISKRWGASILFVAQRQNSTKLIPHWEIVKIVQRKKYV